jgi:hypothetical protein
MAPLARSTADIGKQIIKARPVLYEGHTANICTDFETSKLRSTTGQNHICVLIKAHI